MNYCYYATHNQHHVRLPSSDSYLYASDSETSSSESAITSSVSGSSSGSSSSASVTPRRMDLVDLDMVKLINTGGSGKVYLVRDKIDRQHLALKVIPKSRNMYSCNKKKVTAEKSIHSFLTMESDDFFLPLVATWCDSENYYLASEYIPGGDLALRIMQQRTFDEVEARFYIAELIVSLERLHARKIIHRDIKPSNILIRPDGHVVLADFGVSKRFEVDVDAELDAFYADYVYDGETSSWSEEGCETGCGSANASLYMTSDDCGTPYFMSPEQHRGDKYSFEVDHWAVGVMLYRMVTGKMPFGDCAMNKGQIARSVLEDDVSFAGHSSTVSMVTQDFILGLLAKDPCHRLHPSEIRRHPFFYGIDWSLVEHRELEAPWLPYIAPIPKQSRPIFAGYRELQNPSWTEERDAAAESFTWYSPYARLRHVCPPKGSGSSHSSSSSGSSSRPTSNFDSVRWKSWIRGIFCSNEGNGKSSTRRRTPRRRR